MATKTCNYRRGCDKPVCVTRKGKVSSKCQYHYDQQYEYDQKRKNTPSRIKYYKERENKPSRIKWKKQYEKKRSKDPKRRKATNASVAKWRLKYPIRAKQIELKVKKSIKHRLYNVKYSANKRKIKVTMTDEQIKTILLTNKCTYCGTEDDMVGIDRIDSNKIYSLDNSVSCCKICNKMKHVLPVDTFIKRCQHIASYQGLLQNKQSYPDCFEDHKRVNYTQCRGSANRRNKVFELNKATYDEIVKEDCYLCGKQNTSAHQNGIDRVKNEQGYIQGNMKSCCGACNFMKKDIELSVFMDRCTKIASN